MIEAQIKFLGIDLGKNWFHVVGIDDRSKALLRKKLTRANVL